MNAVGEQICAPRDIVATRLAVKLNGGTLLGFLADDDRPAMCLSVKPPRLAASLCMSASYVQASTS
jgi:hypothetical protein